MQEKIKEILNTIREDNDLSHLEKFNPEDRFREDLHFSSLDLATMTAMIEDEFEVDVFEDGIISTVGELLEKIK